MTREEIENGNKLISIFACNKKADGTIDSNTIGGYPEGTMHFSLEGCPINTMYPFNHKYAYYCAGEWNSNWSWLMPVCYKISEYIKDIYLIEERSNDVEDILRLFHNGLSYTQDDLKVSTNIKDVYDDVVAFIEWYNENK